jgi:hypothetical protein
MAKQIFVLGIGGTGMRCIESFIHLCAMGMFDDTDVHLLALDTDKDNGNFKRLRDLKDAYSNTKGINKTHSALKDTFFSANIIYYQFSPDYSTISNFEALYKYGDTQFLNPERTAIADLLLSENTRQFDLKHGYRAQTHLGSMLMYHSIIEDVTRNNTSQLSKFIEALVNSAQAGKPRVFILGSVFGGTGASSIPIIPKALMKAASIITEATDIERNAFFGSTLLTGYFSFKLPGDVERTNQKIIATSEKFALNSQAAMMFYEADDTVKKTYQKFYMLGTEGLNWKPGKVKAENQTLTGGMEQENDSHYIELLAAFAAYDFFNLDELELQRYKDGNLLDYLYRTIEDDGKITFTDFVGAEGKDELAKKFGLLVAMSFLVNIPAYDFMVQAVKGGLDNKQIKLNYKTIDLEEINNLKRYMELFHFKLNKGGEIKDGWLRQIHRSAGGGDKFLFNPELFKTSGFTDFKFNDKLFSKESGYAKNEFSVSLISNIFSTFKTEFLKVAEPTTITEPCERLIKHTYDTLCKLYEFK